MYVIYIDESGDPGSWNNQNHFVLGGVAVHEGQIYNLTERLDNIQKSYFPGLFVPVAFHAHAIREGKERFRDLRPEIRDQLLEKLYQVFYTTRFPNLITFASAIHVSAVVDPDQALHDIFQDMCMRFNTFLVNQFKHGIKDKGLLVIDRAHQMQYRRLLADFRKSGTDYGYIGNLVDIPYFAGRQETRMLQLADLCAYAVFRRYESKDTSYFKKVMPRFARRSPGGPLDGLKHITKEPCSCEACVR